MNTEDQRRLNTVDQPGLQRCVVCGQGSHRTDWINKSGNFVACDDHSAAQVAQAVSRAQAPLSPTGKPGAPATPAHMASIPKAS